MTVKEIIKNDICKIYERLENIECYYDDNDYIDVDNFISELKKDNLYTEELENFIEQYLKYHNN